MSKKRIGEVLIDEGLLQAHHLTEALRIKQEKGGRLGEILIGLGLLSEEAFQQVLARHFSLPYMGIDELLKLKIDLLSQIPYQTSLQYLILPFAKEGNTLQVAALAPLAKADAHVFRKLTHTLEVRFILATRQNLNQAIRYHYGRFLRSQTSDHKKNALSENLSQELALRKEGNCSSCGFLNDHSSTHCTQCGSLLGKIDDPFIGKVIGKKWKLIKQLGEGGMGLVYQGFERKTQNTCAIKLLRTQLKSDDAVVQRFEREVQILRRLQHHGIIEVFEFEHQEGIGHYLAMELLEGCTFAEFLEDFGPSLKPQEIYTIISQICDAMQHAHNQGVVHRDLKPENIFLVGGPENTEQIKLLDFGIAKLQEHENSRLTQTGTTLGTPHYLSPEQAVAKDVDHRSDIYSLSVMLFELLTGDMLFDADSPFQYLMRHVYAKPRTLSQARPDQTFSPKIEALVRAGLAKLPSERPSSMEKFKQYLHKAITEQLGFEPSADSARQSVQKPSGQYHLQSPSSQQATGDFPPASQDELPTADFSEEAMEYTSQKKADLPSYIIGADEWDEAEEKQPTQQKKKPRQTQIGILSKNSTLKKPPTAKSKPPIKRPVIQGAVWEAAHKKDRSKRLFLWFFLLFILVGGGAAIGTFPTWKYKFIPTENEIRQTKDRWKELQKLPEGYRKKRRRRRYRKKRRRRRYRKRRRHRRKNRK